MAGRQAEERNLRYANERFCFLENQLLLCYPDIRNFYEVIIKKEDVVRIFEYIKGCDGREVNFRMFVEKEEYVAEDRLLSIFISEPMFYKHESTVMDYEVSDRSDLARMLGELSDEKCRNLKVFCHSHAGSGCFWSNLDEEDIERQNNKNYLVFLVFDLRNEKLFYNCRIEIYPQKDIKNVRDNLRTSIINVPVKVLSNGNSLDYGKIKQEMMEKARETNIPKRSELSAQRFSNSRFLDETKYKEDI